MIELSVEAAAPALSLIRLVLVDVAMNVVDGVVVAVAVGQGVAG
jgi:hypothetical protein